MSKILIPLMLALAMLFACTGTTQQSTCEQFPEAAECQPLDSTTFNWTDSMSAWINSLKGNRKVTKVENLRLDSSSIEYINVSFDTLREEQKAILELKDSTSCGIQFNFTAIDPNDDLVFLIDGRFHSLINNYASGQYIESMPCGNHNFRWELTKRHGDGLSPITLQSIRSIYSANVSYNGDWSFEKGWPLDLNALDWVLNNDNPEQGLFSLWAGYLRDEETRKLIILIGPGSTKLNFYYDYSDASKSYIGEIDSATLRIGDDIDLLNQCCWSKYHSTKYSVILDGTDTTATIHFRKSEDGYSRFMIDDIRLLSTPAVAQTDGIWDFEDGFYPTEISHGWTIDNQDAYEGEYSIRAPKTQNGVCGFDIQTEQATNMSFWTKCTSKVATQVRVLNADSTQSCKCQPYWTECSAKLNGTSAVHFETDCISGLAEERRIDLIKAW